MVAWHSGNTFD